MAGTQTGALQRGFPMSPMGGMSGGDQLFDMNQPLDLHLMDFLNFDETMDPELVAAESFDNAVSPAEAARHSQRAAEVVTQMRLLQEQEALAARVQREQAKAQIQAPPVVVPATVQVKAVSPTGTANLPRESDMDSVRTDNDDEKYRQVARKDKHRHTEKKRREKINTAVQQIQQLCDCTKQTDKAAVLQTAVQQLRQAKEQQGTLRRLEEENAMLRSQLAGMSVNRPQMTEVKQSTGPHLDYKSIFLRNGMAMCVASLDMKVLDMNQKFAALVGAKIGDPGLSCMSLSPVEDFHKLFQLMQRLMSGEASSGQCLKKMKALDGRSFDVLATLVMVRHENTPKYILAMITPIEELSLVGRDTVNKLSQ